MPRGKATQFFFDTATGSMVIREGDQVRIMQEIGASKPRKKRKAGAGKRLGRPPKAVRKPRSKKKEGDDKKE